MPYPPYPTPRTTTFAVEPVEEQSADPLPWPVWRIVHSPRWVRSSRGPDYLAWQGTTLAIVFDHDTGAFRYDLGEGRSAGSWPTELEAKTAAAEAVLALPRRDKERAALLLEQETRKDVS